MSETTAAVTQPLIQGLLKDPDFPTRFPQFGVLKSIKPPANPRCKRCAQKGFANTQIRTFSAILLALAPDKLAALKKELGVGQFQLQVYNPTTKKHTPKVL